MQETFPEINFSEFTNIKYVDSSVSSTGNGDSPATPLKTIHSYTDKTLYICRRNRSDETNLTLFQPGSSAPSPVTIDAQTKDLSGKKILIISMPKPTDPAYVHMPQEAKDAWDSDEYNTTLVQFTSSQSSSGTFSAARMYFYGCTINYILNYSSSVSLVTVRTLFFFKKCRFTGGQDYTLSGNTTDTSNAKIAQVFQYSPTLYFDDCTISMRSYPDFSTLGVFIKTLRFVGVNFRAHPPVIGILGIQRNLVFLRF